MDFGALPPEINSGRMYCGPGCGPMLAAAAAWHELAADLDSAAASYQTVIWDLTDAAWRGPGSVAMTGAAAAYVSWMTTTAALCEQTATQAGAAATAYGAAFAMTVPPPVIAANRILLLSLIATNILGQNTPVIAATEADYGEMWAQDAAAMYEYAAASAAAMALPPFTSPPPTTNPAGGVAPVAAVAHASATPAGTASQLLSAAPNALQGLALPLPATEAVPSFLQLLSLLSPVNLAVASASTAITSTGTAGSYAGLGYAVHYDPEGAGKLDAILARLGAVCDGSGTSALASSGSVEVGAGSGAAPVMSAGSGRAPSIGALSVPPAWAAATSPIRLVAAASPNTISDVIPAVLAASPDNLLNESLLASMALRGVGGGATQARSTVIKTLRPRPRAADNWG
jgi:PPE-repeat protein